ncbi:capsular polysaccharide biosynthesis protein CapF [Geotalea uraniireducens]|uniref:NAD-dependent epimerase/dehydratase n=1 Tax=Geotalea uraniireducens (strain Rf4) TaxID=351605 RepID=A5GEN3_GEOUR|nr:capsular polysaccharide biosynthesis protein CapF [Geotalea uraniireducens]ABQ25888.1 NAD-dependent epimerase/dehydratase [Geotalea uraniireducens Rf4]
MKTVLITGSNGFVGRNLTVSLTQRKNVKVTGFDVDDDQTVLSSLVAGADFIFHLAGVNRPQNVEEFTTGNTGLTQTIVSLLQKQGKKTPLVISSSSQAAQDNPYGISKRDAEDAVFAYGRQTGAPVYVYRLPNVFGKWCRPNYNSAVATFCNNIANDLPIQINDPNMVMNLVFIDDVVNSFIAALDGSVAVQDDFCQVQPVHTARLGEIAALIHSFRESREDRSIPDISDPFTKKLYSTYLSYLPVGQFSYPLKMNVDERGSFTEFIKTPDRGQVSVNISKPSIAKGNHWHHTKNEKFLVVSGEGVIRFRKVGSEEIIEYNVSGEKLEVVDIPTGYTHSITNTGETDMVTVMWCNEMYDPEKPDTFFEPVNLYLTGMKGIQGITAKNKTKTLGLNS